MSKLLLSTKIIFKRVLLKRFSLKRKTGFKPAPLHTDKENFDYFEQYFIEEAYSAFLPHWCYTNTELEYIESYQHYRYPAGGKSKWANRDYHHMNKELNKYIAEYFYELSRTDT